MNDRIKQNMLWNSIGSIVYMGGQWLLSILVVRLLGYGEAGVLSLAMSLTNTFYSLANYGIRNFQVSDLKEQFTDIEYIYNRIITSGMAILFCLLYCKLNEYEQHANIAIVLFMCFRICEAFQDVYYGIEQKNADMRSIGISNIIKGALGAIFFGLAAILFNNLNVAIFVMLLTILFVLVFFDQRQSRPYLGDTKGKFYNAYKILWTCAPIALNNFMTNYILAYPKLAIEQNMGKEELGVYSSIGMPVLIVQMASSYIFAPLITTFAEFYVKKQITFFYKLLFKVILMITALGLTALVMAKLGGKLFLKILFGETICQYIYILYPLILCTTLTALIWFLNALLTICREYVGLCVSSAVSIAILLLCSLKMIECYSYNGASLALCLTLLVKTMIMSVTLVRKLKRRVTYENINNYPSI